MGTLVVESPQAGGSLITVENRHLHIHQDDIERVCHRFWASMAHVNGRTTVVGNSYLRLLLFSRYRFTIRWFTRLSSASRDPDVFEPFFRLQARTIAEPFPTARLVTSGLAIILTPSSGPGGLLWL